MDEVPSWWPPVWHEGAIGNRAEFGFARVWDWRKNDHYTVYNKLREVRGVHCYSLLEVLCVLMEIERNG